MKLFSNLIQDGGQPLVRALQGWHGVLQSVYVYDHSTRSVAHPGQKDGFPWPVLFLLACHHKKHVFLWPRKPSISCINFAANQLRHRIHWKWHFQQLSDKTRSSWHVLQARAPIKPFNGHVIGAVAAATTSLSAHIQKIALRAISRVHGQYSRFRASMVVRMALQILQTSDLAAIPTDKDGGFVLLEKDVLLRLSLKAFDARYLEISSSTMNVESAVSHYINLCRRVSRFYKDRSLLPALLADLRRFGTDGIVSKLQLQLKTHKAPGEVAARNLHASVHHPFGPLGKLLSRFLREQLHTKYHLVKNSQDLVRKLRNYSFPQNSVLVTADVADFFMTGDHAYLAAQATKFFSGEEKAILSDVIHFLTYHQYIGSPVIDANGYRRFWHVKCGSGMGCNFSSELSDAAFYFGAEVNFTLLQRFRRDHRCLAYFRFRDDILAVVHRVDGSVVAFAEDWRAGMATQGCPWELEKWQISSLGINFLDVHLYFDSSGSIQYKPYIKPTSLGIPLSCSSAHNAPIHLAWPKAALKRYYALSSTIESYHEARDVLIQRLRSFGASRGLLRALTEFDPGAKLVTKKSNKEKSIWWPLPWHPAWASAQFDRRIAAWRCRPEIDVLFRDAGIGDCAIRVAWSLAGSHLFSLVRKKTT